MVDHTIFENKTAVYYTLGCKLNFAETSAIGKILEEQGIRKARNGEKADICIINTCSVTELADKKCRQTIRKIARQNRSSPRKVKTYGLSVPPVLEETEPAIS